MCSEFRSSSRTYLAVGTGPLAVTCGHFGNIFFHGDVCSESAVRLLILLWKYCAFLCPSSVLHLDYAGEVITGICIPGKKLYEHSHFSQTQRSPFHLFDILLHLDFLRTGTIANHIQCCVLLTARSLTSCVFDNLRFRKISANCFGGTVYRNVNASSWYPQLRSGNPRQKLLFIFVVSYHGNHNLQIQ